MIYPFLFTLLLGLSISESDARDGGQWESTIMNCMNKRIDNDWRSALNETVQTEDVEGTSLLIKYCVNDPKDLKDPLFTIVRKSKVTPEGQHILKVLIENGVDVDGRDQGETPLHAAVHMWNFEFAKTLIESGADVNGRNKHGQTAMHIACKRGTLRIVKLLIQNGADINAEDDTGETPLIILIYTYDFSNIGKYLIENGADISAIDANGNNLLHLVCSTSKLKLIKALIDAGLDVNTQNNDGDTCLHLTKHNQGGKYVADLLIRNNADINIKNNNGTLPHDHFNEDELKLLIFFANLKKDAAKAINESGIDVNAKDMRKRSTLFWAADWNQTDAVRILIENGAECNTTDNGDFGQFAPIIFAGYRGNAAVARMLVGNGADVNSANAMGVSALSSAAEFGHPDVARVLITELGANINARNFFQETPLHAAIRSGHDNVARVLIELGADLDAKTEFGDTPLDTAKRYRRDDIVAIPEAFQKRERSDSDAQ